MDVLRLGSIATIFSMVGGAARFAKDAPNEFFEKRIRPVLSAKCYSCHSDTKAGRVAAYLTGGIALR